MVDLHPWSLAELRQTAIASLADAQRPENDLRTRTDLAFDGVYGLCLHFARKKGDVLNVPVRSHPSSRVVVQS